MSAAADLDNAYAVVFAMARKVSSEAKGKELGEAVTKFSRIFPHPLRTVEENRAYARLILEAAHGRGELRKLALALLDAVETYRVLELECFGGMSEVEALMRRVFSLTVHGSES